MGNACCGGGDGPYRTPAEARRKAADAVVRRTAHRPRGGGSRSMDGSLSPASGEADVPLDLPTFLPVAALPSDLPSLQRSEEVVVEPPTPVRPTPMTPLDKTMDGTPARRPPLSRSASLQSVPEVVSAEAAEARSAFERGEAVALPRLRALRNARSRSSNGSAGGSLSSAQNIGQHHGSPTTPGGGAPMAFSRGASCDTLDATVPRGFDPRSESAGTPFEGSMYLAAGASARVPGTPSMIPCTFARIGAGSRGSLTLRGNSGDSQRRNTAVSFEGVDSIEQPNAERPPLSSGEDAAKASGPAQPSDLPPRKERRPRLGKPIGDIELTDSNCRMEGVATNLESDLRRSAPATVPHLRSASALLAMVNAVPRSPPTPLPLPPGVDAQWAAVGPEAIDVFVARV